MPDYAEREHLNDYEQEEEYQNNFSNRQIPAQIFQTKLKARLNGEAFHNPIQQRLQQTSFPFLQTQLQIGQPHDPYEQEADRIAEQVVSTAQPVQRKCAACEHEEKIQAKPIASQISPLNPAFAQKKCTACEAEEQLQRKFVQKQGDEGTASDQLESEITSTQNSGQTLDAHTQSEMESGFGTDFSGVNIHTDSQAVQMNEELGARAFTTRNDIYFNQGEYRPDTEEGKRLLAHELTHVIQQTNKTQNFQTPDIQKFDAHEKIQERLRAKNTEMITEAPIPGGEITGKGFSKKGYADLYKSTGSIIPGIYGAKYKEEEDPVSRQQVKKYAYKNLNASDSLKKAEGNFTRNPRLTQEPISVIYENGQAKYYEGLREISVSNKSSLITGAFPQDFFVGDIKKGDDNLLLAETQIKNYRKGLQDFSMDAHRDFGVAPTNEGQLYKDVVIPEGLDYSKFTAQNATLGEGNLTDQAGKYTRRYWLYPYREKGIYLYIWLPHPWSTHVPKYQQAGKDVMDELDRVNKALKVTQKKPGKKLDTKPKKMQTASQTQNSAVKQKNNTPKIQKETDWTALKKTYLEKRNLWIDQHAKKYLKNKDIDNIVEEKLAFDKKVGIPSTSHGEFAKVAQQFKNIDFWAGPKGRIVAELRFMLGEKFDILASKFEEIKARTKKTRDKADALSDSRISVGWKKKVIKELMKGFKLGFKVFIAETYAIFARCIGDIIQKFEDSFTQIEEVEVLLTQLEGLQHQLENLLNEIKTKYEDQMKVFEDTLALMEDIKFYADILSTAETLIRVGIQAVSCVSPPALGCLWGLVAQVGIEVGLDLVVGTEWFENEFMRPLVKKLIDEFLKDDILAFMNKLFAGIGLADYIKDVEACKVSISASASAGTGWYSGTPTIPASQYKQHATDWEAKHKNQILGDIAASFSGGTTGKTITKDDIEKLMKEVKDKKINIEDFKSAVQNAQKGEYQFDFNALQGSVQSGSIASNKNEDQGDRSIALIDARTKATEDEEQGTPAEGVQIKIDAKSIHTKGASPELTIWLFENGEHIATAVNVPSTVVKRKWWPSESEKKKLEIHYLIPKKIPFIKGYFIAKGKIIHGYAQP